MINLADLGGVIDINDLAANMPVSLLNLICIAVGMVSRRNSIWPSFCLFIKSLMGFVTYQKLWPVANDKRNKNHDSLFNFLESVESLKITTSLLSVRRV
jgi:hypothetical protein